MQRAVPMPPELVILQIKHEGPGPKKMASPVQMRKLAEAIELIKGEPATANVWKTKTWFFSDVNGPTLFMLHVNFEDGVPVCYGVEQVLVDNGLQ